MFRLLKSTPLVVHYHFTPNVINTPETTPITFKAEPWDILSHVEVTPLYLNGQLGICIQLPDDFMTSDITTPAGMPFPGGPVRGLQTVLERATNTNLMPLPQIIPVDAQGANVINLVASASDAANVASIRFFLKRGQRAEF